MNCIWAGTAIVLAGLAWVLTATASDPDTVVTWPQLQLAATLPMALYLLRTTVPVRISV